MKSIKSSLGAKITALLLFVISLVVLAVCTVGIVYLAYNNVYFDGGKSARENLIYDYLNSKQFAIAESFESYVNNELPVKKDDKKTGYEAFSDYYAVGEEGFSFSIKDETETVLFSYMNTANPKYEIRNSYMIIEDMSYEEELLYFDSYVDRWNYITECEDKYFDVLYETSDMNTDSDESYECILNISYVKGVQKSIQVYICTDGNFTEADDVFFKLQWLDKLIEFRFYTIALAVVALILCMTTFIFLCCAAGHKAGVEGIHLNWADKIPFDLYCGGIGSLIFFVLYVMFAGHWESIEFLAVFAVGVFLIIMFSMALLLSFATRAKYGMWWKNTLIYRIGRGVIKLMKMVFKAIPVMPKIIIALAVLCFYNLIIAFIVDFGGFMFFWLLECCVLVPVVIYIVMQLMKLRRGIGNIAQGDFESKIDTGRLLPELRACGESINSINSVLSREVNERMKSERFKTELITNVSHDIKTPLTSIINYVDIIKKKDIEDDELRSYIEVLDRQSGRLKKLIEDLVECSKAQTGNMTVNKTSLDLGVLLTQTVGEYDEKLSKNNLSLVVNQPEEPVYISADGRLLWRALDNLLNNACKYSLPGTRVYLNLKVNQHNSEAYVVLKNVSKDQLNMSSDELMERFVRGDSSRNTEGSGLGLSIARSLIELQDAAMDLEIDGDLFKVIIKFKMIGGEFVNA